VQPRQWNPQLRNLHPAPPYPRVNRNFPILIVEDDENDAHLIARAFSAVGFNNPIHFSRDGADAIAYLGAKPPYEDRGKFPFPMLIITDLKMPRVSGLDLLKWLQAHPECQVIPTIMFSSSVEDSDVKTAYQLGVNAFLQKPATAGRLCERIQRIVDFWEQCEIPQCPDKC
jgi:CheY-like chemotaxis protein